MKLISLLGFIVYDRTLKNGLTAYRQTEEQLIELVYELGFKDDQ